MSRLMIGFAVVISAQLAAAAQPVMAGALMSGALPRSVPSAITPVDMVCTTDGCSIQPGGAGGSNPYIGRSYSSSAAEKRALEMRDQERKERRARESQRDSGR